MKARNPPGITLSIDTDTTDHTNNEMFYYIGYVLILKDTSMRKIANDSFIYL